LYLRGELLEAVQEKNTTRLKEWRLSAGYTLDDLAGLSGFSLAMISRAERGQRAFSPRGKVKLARAVGVPVSALFEVEADDGGN
jgi:transcriptional regulator with XRE-family HTH domain